MRIYTAPRSHGKTGLAMSLAIDIDAYLVVKDRREADRVFHQCDGKSRGLRYPITYDELMKYKMHGSYIRKVVIDNIDDFVHYIVTGVGAVPVLGTIDSDFATRGEINDLVAREQHIEMRRKERAIEHKKTQEEHLKNLQMMAHIISASKGE